MTNRLRIKFIFLFFFLFVSVYLPSKSLACMPAGPDPWFSITLTFDNNTLPTGVEIVQTDPTYEPYSLTNRSQEPFYIVKENNTDWKTFPNSELPINYEPLYKLINSQSYYYSSDAYSKPPTAGYKPNSGGINNAAASRVEIDERIYTLDDESMQIYKDNRPEHVDIPAPQGFSILAYYKEQPLRITGALSYSLNEEYDPEAFEKGVKACAEWNESSRSPLWMAVSFIPIIILLSFVGLIGFILFRIVKHFRKR